MKTNCLFFISFFIFFEIKSQQITVGGAREVELNPFYFMGVNVEKSPNGTYSSNNNSNNIDCWTNIGLNRIVHKKFTPEPPNDYIEYDIHSHFSIGGNGIGYSVFFYVYNACGVPSLLILNSGNVSSSEQFSFRGVPCSHWSNGVSVSGSCSDDQVPIPNINAPFSAQMCSNISLTATCEYGELQWKNGFSPINFILTKDTTLTAYCQYSSVSKSVDKSISILISKSEKPTITATKGLILGNETSTLTFKGCNIESTYVWRNLCANSDWVSSGSSVAVNVGTYQVGCMQNGCIKSFSDPINILLETASPYALGCSNLDAEDIYNFTRIGNDGRADYHQYNVVTKICKLSESNPSCTLNNVWNTLKSSVWNNAPVAGDFIPKVGNKIPILFSDLAFLSIPNQVENCKSINLPSFSSMSSSIFMSMYMMKIYGRQYGLLFGSFINSMTVQQAPIANPIVQIVDEEQHSISNYTQVGHILHPGRVVRTVVEECGDIYIKTVGVGRSFLGNNLLGGSMGYINIYYGSWLFQNVDNRIKNSF